jgi:hypothetical protein
LASVIIATVTSVPRLDPVPLAHAFAQAWKTLPMSVS